MAAWRSAAFLGLFGDPYLRATPYEAGGDPQALVGALSGLAQLLQPQPPAADEDPVTFSLSVEQERVLQTTLLPQLAFCGQWAEKGAKVEDAVQFQSFLAEWKAELAKLQPGQPVLAPGGYVGNATSHAIIYVLERTGDAEYSFTVCNKGPGAEMYHPCKVEGGADKIRVQSCVQIGGIPASRFLDMAFWTLLFSLWVRKPPSEYHRVETIYDVLLPWLAGDKLLPLASEATEQRAPSDWTTAALGGVHTAQRSQLGFCKSVVEAVRYLCLRSKAFTNDEVEYAILYKLRYRLFQQVVKGLEIAEDPAKGVPEGTLDNALRTLSTISLQDSLQGTHTVADIDPEAVVGIYFAQSTSAACRKLTKLLTVLSERLHTANKKFAVIVVSVDQEQADYTALIESLPGHTWLMVPFSEMEARKQLIETFGVRKVPQLIVRRPDGTILTPMGKELVMSDPTGEFYPWTGEDFKLPKSTLSVFEIKCIAMGVKQIGLKTLKHHERKNIQALGLSHVNKLMSQTEHLIESVGVTPSSDGNSKRETATLEETFPFAPHANAELLQLQGKESEYAGNASELEIPTLSNFLDVPERVMSIPLAVAAFVRCEALCESLLKRAAEGSSSSRVSLHHEVIQLITSVLVEVLPVPEPNSVDGAASPTCMWRQPVAKDMQLRCLNHLHSLLMVLGSVWQSMEQPSRQFDSERALAALCVLCITDALIRTSAADDPLEISLMMEEEGGYVLAHTFCKANFSIQKMTSAMEFARPNFCVFRGEVLAYFHSQDARGKRQLFDYHMPEDKIEVKKYSTTLLFFRQLMERYHYQLIDPNNQTPPTEMEALMEWFCSDTTPMADEHPEVGLTRDLVMVVKFLATMETKEVELMRRRTAHQHWQMWQLSFDDSSATHRRNFFGMRGLNQILHATLKWEVVNFRGSDQDIADVEVQGFMERKVYFGEGPIVTSPANLGALLVKSSSNTSAGSLPTVITEDDIMHLTDLPTYNVTLSAEESEYLMSYLTVPYTRIPLVVSFFSSRDRVTYLFNPMLQQLFRAVLFEGGDWVSDEKSEEISHIPLRKSNLVMHEEAIQRTFDARVHHQKCEDHLGTMNGLLLNELIHAPEAIVVPLLKMLDAVKELGEASVHSADARFILFMIKLGVDVLRYMTFALDRCITGDDQARVEKLEGYRSQLMAYVFGFAHTTLNKWRQEAEEANNLQTSCVIHSYLALLHVSLRSSEYDAQKISEMIGSIAYVHNWHCFGMKLSTDGVDEKGGLSAEERLLRWLQAQGIDTANVGKKSLEKYLKGRPLYLKIGMQTIQAPSIVALRNNEGKELQLPPGDVLEAEIFETIQLHRRSIVQWLVSLPKTGRNKVLGNIVRIALRSTEPTDSWEWIEESGIGGAGKFSCRKQELKLDAQTGEILWRNDELKPVPDSMTQYGDFMAIFGNKSLHCGLVARQEHRLWVNIVGTDYQLVEWDDPTHEIDQGVGAPVVYEPGTGGGSDNPTEDPQELKMYWECPACTCANFNGDNPNATCEVCGTPRIARAPPQQSRETEEKPKQAGDDGFRYLGTTFSRPFDIYSEKEHPHADEQWFVDLVGNALRLMYPPVPDDKKLPYTLFLPTDPLSANATHVRLIGLDRGSDDKDKEKIATFKEIVAYRTMQVMHMYALVSYGRRLYRKLVFTSNSRLSLHSFPLNISPDQGPVDPALLRASGEPTERQMVGGSLVILRKNHLLNGTEQFVPPRILQGVVPSCLLENFRFWIGEDGRMRGEPVDSKSQWFRYRVEIEMKETGQAIISRKSIMTSFSRIYRDNYEKVSSATSSQMQPPPAPVRVPGRSAAESSYTPSYPSPDSIEISDDDVVQLMAMGFSYAGCGLALRENRNNMGLAAQWLLDENNQMKILAAEEAAASGEVSLSPEEQQEQNIGLLMSLEGSPSRVAIEYALELFAKDLELAKAWLADPANRAEIQRAECARNDGLERSTPPDEAPTPMEVDQETKDGEENDEALELVEETVGETLYLLSMLDACSARESEEVVALSELLSRVEDLSHILVWCTNKDEQSAPRGLSSVAFIELPRLKLKLQPVKDPLSGRVRLSVMDQNGWFVSDLTVAMPEETSRYLRGLVKIAPDCFVLESDTTDLKLICPNHDLYRPAIRGEPFSSILVSDRGSVGWQKAMETRFYTYPVHSSNTFLLPSSLSSTLYLILTSLLTRNYAEAMELILGCNVDVKFTDEEKRVFDQLAKTLDDRHPNACACRIRLSLGIAYSDNKAPWNLSGELHDYLTTSGHVDASCKLTLEEEKEALAHCHQRSPLLLLRKDFCDHVKADSEANFDFKLSRSRVGGQPWMKLCLYSNGYLAAHSKKLSTVRYNRPKHGVGIDNTFLIDDEESGKLVWNCAVVGDEISGTNRGLGFLFLYECLNQQLIVRMGGEDCTRSFGDLFARFLHLKLSRWGRETVDDGEEECAPSYAMAQLAMVIAHPGAGWPSSPCDQESVHMLSRGANLYSKMTVGTMLKHFFDFGEMEFQSKLESEDHQTRVIAPIKAQFGQLHHTAEHAVKISIAATDESKNFDASNASCGERQFMGAKNSPINPEFPLEAIDVKRFITFCDPEAEVEATLPFDLSQHPVAQTAAAKDLLKRLGDDIAINAHAENGSKDAYITGVTPMNLSSSIEPNSTVSAVESLQMLILLCEKMRTSDRKMVEEGIAMLEMLLNEVRGDIHGDAEKVVAADRFVMQRHVGVYPRVTFDFLTSLLASDCFEADLKARNPFVVNVTADLVEKILLVLFLCSRIVHINRTVQAARALVKHLNGLASSEIGDDKSSRAKMTRQASRDLADMLISKRYYLHGPPDSGLSGWKFDPRFLVFDLEKGNSRVQQMIMGAGKTTVVGPLLTYILADKEHLVTHVMPTALLEQSRQVLRSRFSNRVLRKRIFTFEFDRAISDDPAAALQMYTKLDRARRHGDVVCASPESIKSMMLKLVELLHSLDESSDIIELPLTSASQNIRRLRRVLEDRSEMADELHKTLRLWQNGILIMDEVDVLLHPLRSELNFPIGNKFPIDLAANRWELPIYLIDAVLASPNTSKDPTGLIPRLHAVLDEGYAAHTLQRFPHLVLLDMEFYEARMLPLLSEIAIEWLLKLFRMGKMEVSVDRIKYYLECPRAELHTDATLRADIENGLSESSIKLLNLARDWLRTILPHVLSKINRVSYGLLRGEHQTSAASGNSGGNAHSRLMLAVPFIGKDVPSRSSEFAHPDVLIGLTILAYRYEGIRVSDLVRIVSQLKQDFSRQLGPRDQRPACAMFREWVRTGLAALVSEKQEASGGVLPLPLFQLRDSAQVARLHFLVAKLAGVVYYYVRQHVFPSCMNFQKLKISACGHELGSNSLFAKRIGFSGTPSNLLPMDLGECYYEPRSDGSIFEALTNKRIVSIERKVEWTARSLLLDIAHAQPPVHALIDTGALITGFDNQKVAAFLLAELPPEMEGVVYLDEDDRQMILLRDHNAPMPLVQCGLSPSKRFTFYDQVHTTGMDIKQCVNARAVVTLGKDMTFRDYAQGAYRMRGIATGQSICLFLIPEVENRIRHEMKLAHVELSTQASAQQRLDEFLLLVPAWLLINSMRMESMQLVQLSLQELYNTWRRRALHSLLDEIAAATTKEASLSSRLRRFIGREDDSAKAWLRKCIAIFRVEISYNVDAVVPTKKQLSDVIGKLVESHKEFLKTNEETARVTAVKQRLAHSSGSQQQMLAEDGSEQGDLRLTAEVVHENEAEAEEEAEEEAEQEEQKMSAFTRDDEHPIPWSATVLVQPPAGVAASDIDEEMKTAVQQHQEEEANVFYPFSQFQAHAECPKIAFPPALLMSGNFFRRRWVGLGERRVKNVGLILEWSPLLHQEAMKTVVQQLFMAIMAAGGGGSANEIAVKALQAAAEMATTSPNAVSTAVKDAVAVTTSKIPVYLATLSLAEGETIRRMIHKKHPVFQISQVQLRTSEGELVESSSFFSSWAPKSAAATLSDMAPRERAIAVGVQCLRFFNNEMYYFSQELELLLEGLATVPISLRHEFFECLLRLRRRERHLWGDTPLAKVFTAQSEWHLLTARARLQQFQQSLLRKQRQYQKKKEKGKDPKPTMAALHLAVALRRFDEDEDSRLSAEEVHKCFESFQLGFSSKELNEIIGLIADARFTDGEKGHAQGIPMETICAAFGISRDEMKSALLRDDQESARAAAGLGAEVSWGCPVCTYVNDGASDPCGACNEPNPKHQDEDLQRQQQQQGWRCGNCTFINQPDDVCCAICELDMDGQRGVPRGKWVCAGEQGGCTFFNSMTNFYCEVCNRARPDLASTHF
ncbi:hypothetical protein PF007_g10769 [Phytophthora fragariae]|uniref:ubiquitinyl hydrolase 1 n=3 Tax=Phytophthora fragariae TaxID=53985 RepID=A0A6A4EGJ4_9STRA|nr:hypothetical protein PF011_g9352 [Phytophthora fragariae]KAE9113313.1 hypothetical protein PF007_g10769 [Phytophthora fragariae]KAE9317566.1 hypothetical protein PF001_g6791 [Phytophthora fragariae]